MPAFDAELFLRLAAERDLLDRRPAHHMGPTPTAVTAGALAAAGCLADGVAAAVLAEYASAKALRGGEVHDRFWGMPDDDAPGPEELEPFPPRRTFVIGEEVTHRLGSLRVKYVSFGADTTVLAVALKSGTSSFHQPPNLTLADDGGRRQSAVFDGYGWDDDGIEGQFGTEEPLTATTRWIEVDGHRFALTREVTAPEVRIETLPERDPALRHLWRLAVPDEFHHRPTPLEPAIQALLAAGVLAGDHPDLDAIRAVERWLSGHGGPQRSLPEPFRSLRRGGHADGPTGTLVVGAVTPVFDGFAIAVDALESGADGWNIAVRTAVGGGRSGFDGAALPGRHLAWWAADDRRRTYLGHTGNWHGEVGYGSGTIYFEGALDPKAGFVELRPTADEHRAVIRVPLEWS